MDNRDVEKALEELFKRMEAIERRLDSITPREIEAPAPPPLPAQPEPTEDTKSIEADQSQQDVQVSPTEDTPPTEPLEPSEPAQSEPKKFEPRRKFLPTHLSKRDPEDPQSHEPAEQREGAFSNLTFENLVGGRLYAILGALLVIIATGILLKLAWDAELFNLLPDQLKCALAALFGGALIVGGELARRKISAWASIGLTTAGLGVLYATSYAAWGIFNVVPSGVGFALLMATTALGIIIGARSRLVSVAALSLIGGYLSPLMFSDVESSPYTLPVYLIALLCVGLVLCARYGGGYAVLRSISWWGTILFGTAWLLMNKVGAPTAHMVFISCVWSIIQLELVYSASRSRLSETKSEGDQTILEAWQTIRPIASSVTTTAWAIALALVTFREQDIEAGVWLIPLLLAGVLLAASAFKVGIRTILCTRPATDLHRLAVVFVTEAGALIFVAVAIAFDDWTGVIAWTVLGLGAVVAGDRIRSRALVIYGMVTQAIGGTNLVVLKWWMIRAVDPDIMSGFVITRGTVLMIVSAIGWLITGMLIRRSSTPGTGWRITAHVLMGLGITMSFAGFLNDQSTALQVTWIAVMLAAMIMTVGTGLGSPGLKAYGITIQAVTWLLLMSYQGWFADPQIQFWGVTLTVWFWPTLALSTISTGSALIALRERLRPWDVTAIVLAAFAFAVLALGFAHEDTAPTSLMIIWLLLSGGLMAAHRIQPRLQLSRIGLAGVVAAILPLIQSVSDIGWNQQQTTAFLTTGMWWSLLMVAAVWTAGRFERLMNKDKPSSEILASIAVGIGTVLLFITSSLEVARLSEDIFSVRSGLREAVSIWWGLFAIALLILGFKRNVSILRYTGLGLLALAAVKAVLFDLASVSAVWRAMSFLILGLLMLGVGLVYARAMSHAKARQDNNEEQGET